MSLSCYKDYQHFRWPQSNWSNRRLSWINLKMCCIWCYSTCMSGYSARVHVPMTSQLCGSARAVAWSPLAHAPHKWNSRQVDNPTFPSFADGIAPGPSDDLVRPEVPDAFLAGRADHRSELRNTYHLLLMIFRKNPSCTTDCSVWSVKFMVVVTMRMVIWWECCFDYDDTDGDRT